jgi:hypothetical protein
MNSTTNISILRDPGEPLGLYFRVGRDDHTTLKQLLSENRAGLSGVVFDPCFQGIQQELKAEIVQRNLDAILDPQMMELAGQGGHTPARQRLPWGGPTLHVPGDFDTAKCGLICTQIAAFVAKHQFTAVLAPTHYLHDGASDPWLAIDKQLVIGLRECLDANHCQAIPLYYPLAIPMKMLTNGNSRLRLKAALRGLPIDGIWLRIQPFGSSSGDTTLRRYIAACQELHTLELPLIAEKTGVLGLALLAFGAVSGIDCGVSSGEKFDFARLMRAARKNGTFRRAARVYLPDLGGFLTRQQADRLFKNSSLRKLACRDSECCRRGHESMLQDPRRHFVYTRMGEISTLSGITPSLRPTEYLEQFVRPITDRLGRVLLQPELPSDLRKTFEKSRKKQDGWRATLGQLGRSRVPSFAPVLQRRVVRLRATA